MSELCFFLKKDMLRKIIYIDMDVFFVLVEEWDYLELVGYLLVIVCYLSDIGGKGVVIIVNYIVW